VGSVLALPSPLQHFWRGVKAEFPILIGVFPFGMIYGVLALDAGIQPGAAQAMSAIVFAGSSQLVTAQLVQTGAPAFVIVLTIAIINLRHALYSASVAEHVKKLNPFWKALLAYLLTDEAYAVTITHYERNGSTKDGHWYFLGAGLALWSTWQVSTALGIGMGAVIPANWSLDFFLALTFIALVVPNLKDFPSLAAALAAGATAVVAYNLPYKLDLVTAALVGILTGSLLERKK